MSLVEVPWHSSIQQIINLISFWLQDFKNWLVKWYSLDIMTKIKSYHSNFYWLKLNGTLHSRVYWLLVFSIKEYRICIESSVSISIPYPGESLAGSYVSRLPRLLMSTLSYRDKPSVYYLVHTSTAVDPVKGRWRKGWSPHPSNQKNRLWNWFI